MLSCQKEIWISGMTKVVISGVKARRASRPSKGGVVEKRVLSGEGKVKILRQLDLRSSTFGTDLQYVFSKNVAKARRDNKRITGSAEGVITKR
jgi:hypothetical protein